MVGNVLGYVHLGKRGKGMVRKRMVGMNLQGHILLLLRIDPAEPLHSHSDLLPGDALVLLFTRLYRTVTVRTWPSSSGLALITMPHLKSPGFNFPSYLMSTMSPISIFSYQWEEDIQNTPTCTFPTNPPPSV